MARLDAGWADVSGTRGLNSEPPQRQWAPLDFKLIKELKTAEEACGVHANFLHVILEQISYSTYLIPEDWSNLARATLAGGQYLMLKAAWREMAADMVRHNAQARNGARNIDMFLGEAQYVGQQAQIQYPEPVYHQLCNIILTSWRALQSTGDLKKV